MKSILIHPWGSESFYYLAIIHALSRSARDHATMSVLNAMPVKTGYLCDTYMDTFAFAKMDIMRIFSRFAQVNYILILAMTLPVTYDSENLKPLIVYPRNDLN